MVNLYMKGHCLLSSALLPINSILKLDVSLQFERIESGIFQNSNTVPEINKVTKYWHTRHEKLTYRYHLSNPNERLKQKTCHVQQTATLFLLP